MVDDGDSGGGSGCDGGGGGVGGGVGSGSGGLYMPLYDCFVHVCVERFLDQPETCVPRPLPLRHAPSIS